MRIHATPDQKAPLPPSKKYVQSSVMNEDQGVRSRRKVEKEKRKCRERGGTKIRRRDHRKGKANRL